jgi:hypothetical protein
VLGLALVGIAYRYVIQAIVFGGNLGSFVSGHCVFDCEFYASIIDGGYHRSIGEFGQPGRANWAFFPLYPVLAWPLVKLAGLTPALAGFILSNLLTIAAATLSRPLFAKAKSYWLFVATLMLGPFSVLFSSLYTESLFILLTILALRSLQRGSYLAAGGWIALLSATRITGVLMVFGLLAQLIADHHRQGGTWRTLPRRVLGDGNLLLAFLVAPLGLFTYMAFLYDLTGDALAFSHIQRSWGRDFDLPFAAVLDAFALGWSFDYYGLLQQSWAIAAISGLALSAVLLRRKRYAEAIFCALCILASLSSGVVSMVRFVAGLAPLGMVLCELLGRRPWLGPLTIMLALLADAVVTIGWFNKSMFLM